MDKIKKNKEISPKKNLQKIREDNHYSQRKVAEDNNTYQEVIYRLESGTRTSNIEFIMQLSNNFHCSTDYLLDLTNDPTPISILSSKSDLSEKEKYILREYNSLSDDNKLRLEGILIALKSIQ